MSSVDIVCMGELLVDMFPSETGVPLREVPAFIPKPGGAPANAAVAAARLGARAAFIGKVGDEAFGHHLASVLEQEGVETRGIRFDTDARTTMTFIARVDENNNQYVFYRNPGADTRLQPEELDLELLRDTRVFHFGSLSLTHEPSRSAAMAAVDTVHRAGGLVSFDVNYRPSLWVDAVDAQTRIKGVIPLADIVKVNDVELALVTGTDDLRRGTSALLEMGPKLCVVTLGPKGAYFATRDAAEAVTGFRVKTVDATGCGDAFIAGLLSQLVWAGEEGFRPAKLRTILRYANAVGALTAEKLGVIPALPTAAEVEKFLAQ